MDCNQIREMLPDLAAGMMVSTPEVEKHIVSCHDCSEQLEGMKQTMALLDEWQAPEPSPYFDTRMQARLREEMARPQSGWLGSLSDINWLRRPVWATSFAAALFVGALAIGVNNQSYFVEMGSISTNPPALTLPVQPGTAVGDLQALERNDDLYADFDVLDQLQVQDDVTATP